MSRNPNNFDSESKLFEFLLAGFLVVNMQVALIVSVLHSWIGQALTYSLRPCLNQSD